MGLAGRETEVVATLSHGEQRQLEIAIALGTRPAVLLLDEPLAGLPDAERGRIVELIKQLARDYAVLLIEHDIDRVLEISKRLTVMHEGRVIATGTPAEIQASAAVQEAYLGRTAEKTRIRARAQTAAGAPLLRLEKVNTFYGASHILHDATLRSIMGAPPPRSGRVTVDAIEAQGWRPHRIARLGLTIVPEGARVFPNLTVMEHMLMAVHHGRKGRWSIPRVLELLPKLDRLKDRRGEHLSGGERKMLGIARGLLANPRLLLLDEPLEGLAPAVADDILTVLDAMRGEMAILLVEHKASLVLPLCESAFILNNGGIVYSGQARDLLDHEARLQHLLGI